MLVVAVVTVLPWASWTVTCTAGVFIAPAAALLGCTVKTTFAAAPALVLNALLVAPVRPVAVDVGVSRVPTTLGSTLGQVAPPLVAAPLALRPRVARAGFVTCAAVV